MVHTNVFFCVSWVARSLTSCPELVCLLEEGEELDGLLALQPEAILLRWFNYHLERVRAEDHNDFVVLCFIKRKK